MNRTLVTIGQLQATIIQLRFSGEEREKGKEKLLGEIMAKMIPNMINP